MKNAGKFSNLQCEITWGIPDKWSVILPVYYRRWYSSVLIVVDHGLQAWAIVRLMAIAGILALLHRIKSRSGTHTAFYSVVPGIKLPGREGDQLALSGAEIKNAWIYTSTQLCSFMTYAKLSTETPPVLPLGLHLLLMYILDWVLTHENRNFLCSVHCWLLTPAQLRWKILIYYYHKS
jgi:hypothetical protein